MRVGKRLAALLLAAGICAALTGCGEKAEYRQFTVGSDGTLTATADYGDLPVAVIEVENFGTIKAVLFEEDAPKAVENFITHAEEGYYDGLTFHRVINDFMIQGGDPKGDGTGGESVWGESFEDEFTDNLYNFRGALSMANSGKDTNGSQFFIVQQGDGSEYNDAYFDEIEEENKMSSSKKASRDYKAYMDYYELTEEDLESYGITKSALKENYDRQNKGQTDFSDEVRQYYQQVGGTPWLDGKHTVFGQVIEGMEVVDAIAGVAVDSETSVPDETVTITSVTIEY